MFERTITFEQCTSCFLTGHRKGVQVSARFVLEAGSLKSGCSMGKFWLQNAIFSLSPHMAGGHNPWRLEEMLDYVHFYQWNGEEVTWIFQENGFSFLCSLSLLQQTSKLWMRRKESSRMGREHLWAWVRRTEPPANLLWAYSVSKT